MRTVLNFVCFLAVMVAAFAANANPGTAGIDDGIIAAIREWATKPVVLISVRAQNERHADLTQSEIEALDQQWRAETKAAEQPLIAQLIGAPLSNYLLQIQAGSLGLYPEIFVMDAKGLNVGQSSVTSDYWQGDEDKWQKTFAVGPDAMFIDEVELHDETKSRRVQVNLPLVDPTSAEVIGALTVELNLEELDRRRAAGIL